MPSFHNMDIEAELSVLTALTADMTLTLPNPKAQFKRRDSEIDPLLLAATMSSGPHVTRNHYAHDFFPGVGDPRAPGAWDWTKWTGTDPSCKLDRGKASYVSRQGPRRQRLREMGVSVEEDDERAYLIADFGCHYSTTFCDCLGLGLASRDAVTHQNGGSVQNERAYQLDYLTCITQRPLATVRARTGNCERFRIPG